MPEKPNARVERLEHLMGVLADKQAQLDAVLVLLTEEQIKTEQRFRETDEHLRRVEQQSRERDRILDERVDKLVSAIGEFIRRRDGDTR